MVVNEDSGLDAHESNIGCGANVIMSGVGFEVPFYKPERIVPAVFSFDFARISEFTAVSLVFRLEFHCEIT